MITLHQNLEDEILFSLLDAKMNSTDAHLYSRDISSTLTDWVRNYFVWYVKHEKKSYNNPEIKEAFDKLIEHIKYAPSMEDLMK